MEIQIYPNLPSQQKKPVHLFYHDPIYCLQSLLMSLLVKDHINFVPFQLFKKAEKVTHIFTEWLSGNCTWEMQVNIEEIFLAYILLMHIQPG